MTVLPAARRALVRGRGSFAGGLATRLCPAVLQLVLIVMVARAGSLADVGRLALASALAFLCGALGEAGALTSLSLPRAYFGEDRPPLRATRRWRWAGAAGSSALYGVLWLAGLGSHEPAFLIALPLPLLLAISSGYGGALNATRALGLEGVVSVSESVVAIAVAAPLLLVLSPVQAALVGLVAGRGLGTLGRAIALRRLPQSRAATVSGLGRTQVSFLASTAAFVLQGQLDLLVLGFYGAFSLIGVFGPLIRACYSTFLVAEGLTLAVYTRPEVAGDGARWAVRNWRVSGLLVGVVAGVIFAVAGSPLTRLIVAHATGHLAVPVLLLALLIPIRFAGYVWSAVIVRAGHQAVRIPILLAGSAFLALGGVAGARMHSLTWLCALRLASEAAVAVGFLWAMRRAERTFVRGDAVAAQIAGD